MLLRCKYQGKQVKDLHGRDMVCQWCEGIEYDPPHKFHRIKHPGSRHIIVPTIAEGAMFNCPVLLKDPRKSPHIVKG